MPTRLNPYLSFKDSTSEVMDFYQSVFGGKLDKTSFKDGGMEYEPGDAEKVMHAQLETDNGMFLMASDTPASMNPEGVDPSNGTISLSGDDEAELKGYYEKLSADGKVTLPLDKAPWGDWFGMCQDRFGVDWMVNISGKGVDS
jgi:PhnB protein